MKKYWILDLLSGLAFVGLIILAGAAPDLIDQFWSA